MATEAAMPTPADPAALPAWAAAAIAALGPAGLQRWGVARVEGPAPLPGARSALVFASGGPALWQGFVDALTADHARLREEAHPLDAHIARLLRAADPAPPPSRLWVRCAADEPTFVDFRPLAAAAGLGWPSRLGLLLHPDDGPWIGLRAACFTTEALPPTGPQPGPGPCAGCPAPCVAACPVGAVPRADGARFEISACAAHRTTGGCPQSCAARNACPEGAPSRYPPEAQAYHEDRARGRAALAARLGVNDDLHAGLGPPWSSWAAPARP
jgi:epoxyqueuosine reductase